MEFLGGAAKFELQLAFLGGRKHLPIVELKKVA